MLTCAIAITFVWLGYASTHPIIRLWGHLATGAPGTMCRYVCVFGFAASGGSAWNSPERRANFYHKTRQKGSYTTE